MTTQATITGNVTRDPELKFGSSGKAYLRLGVAVSKRQQVNGVWEDGPTSFYDVTAFGTLAENVAASIGKGTRIVATGRLEQRSYEVDGQKRSSVELIADEIGAAMTRATVEVHRISRDLAPQRPVADEEPF